jgi:hypothetical protein
MIVEHNFLSKEDCDYFIKMHTSLYDSVGFTWGYNQVIPFYLLKDFFDKNDNEYDYNFLRKIEAKITHHMQCIDSESFIDFLQLVKWNTGGEQDAHCDVKYKKNTSIPIDASWDCYTSILYLNDDYEGGQTHVNGVVSEEPETGKIITFVGNKIFHGVRKITKGIRYTIPVWYTKVPPR